MARSLTRAQVADTGKLVPSLEIVSAMFFAVATGFIGAAVGVWPDLVSPTASDAERGARTISLIQLGAFGLGTFAVALGAWWHRRRILDDRGTIYILDAEPAPWVTDAAKRRLLSQLNLHFPTVLNVAGPQDLVKAWNWPGAAHQGALLWSGAVDDLVLSFRSINSADRQDTRNNIIAWTPWPAAILWSARLMAADRGITLAERHRSRFPEERFRATAAVGQTPIPAISPGRGIQVRHRPSFGRQGALPVDTWRDKPLDFLAAEAFGEHDLSAYGHIYQARHPVRLTLTRPGSPPTSDSRANPSQGRRSCLKRPTPATEGPPKIKILVVGLAATSWTNLTVMPPSGRAAFPELSLCRCTFKNGTKGHDLAVWDHPGVGLSGTFDTEILEFRCLPKDEFHEWLHFPILTFGIASWIAANATAEVNLLGLLVPPEVALGLGIVAAQRLGRKAETQSRQPGVSATSAWPKNLWPLYIPDAHSEPCIPGLSLGAQSMAYSPTAPRPSGFKEA